MKENRIEEIFQKLMEKSPKLMKYIKPEDKILETTNMLNSNQLKK
jgi:hypothetical protein